MLLRFLIVALLAIPPTVLAADITIEGRVFTESGPLPDARVTLHRTFADFQNNTAPVVSAVTDRSGVYRLLVPPGAYYFTARGLHDGKEFFAYHGSNPVKIENDKLWLTLMATLVDLPPVYADGSGAVEGRITYKGQPVTGAYVALYQPENKNFKGLGVKTESAGSDGRFRLNVEPGKYVVTARKISSGKSNRPLQKGDLYCYYSRNPVEVKSGQNTRIEFSCYPKIDRNAFVVSPTLKTDDFLSIADRAAHSGAGIRGRVTNLEGKPIPGLSVLAYRLASPVFMMYHLYHGTEYSAETDTAGAFFIPIDEDGDYGLVARDTLGDGPHRGEIYGLYQGNTRHSITFKKGTLVDNISIVAGKIMESPAVHKADNRQPAQIVGTPGGAPVFLTDSVITHDTVWQGEIHISGVISVKRGATLTIRPGTAVKFRRIDNDRNDVGDGEILVEGRLVAQGTKDRRITFSSAEVKPAVNDWSYLQFLASDPANVIEYCQFEHAFAGIMIHYADVRINDTLFRNNNRGLHYNTANLQVENSSFIDNRIGIRFMRLEGDVRIMNNDITRNDIGVLFVRQHVNAIDFDRLNRGKEAPLFKNNNIFANRTYNFSLGEGQDRDITVSGNWWGSENGTVIGELIYDNSKDTGLSRIIYTPFLVKPVTATGVR